ncbi:MAG: hypothetical protein JW939_03890, partial [Candidatus Thermoplasmatota archaeon]|nr:hypothetical protein [Candidatus Thermoplasmatota archaeon]
MEDEIKDVDKNLAFVIELVGGLFGILGIGYMFSGLIKEGIIRLIVWIAIIVFAWVFISVLIMFLVGICFIPFMLAAQVGVPIWSAFSLKKRLEGAFP